MEKKSFILLLFVLIKSFNAPYSKAQNIYDLPLEGKIDEYNQNFYNPKKDYSRFMGRVTDKDVSGEIIKVESLEDSIKFFRTGDKVNFWVSSKTDSRPCQAAVRATEERYLILFVYDFKICWKGEEYFRRGALLSFESSILNQRIKDASLYRHVLIKKRKDYLNQLNDMNNTVWSFPQQRVKALSGIDEKIEELKKQKIKRIDELLGKHREATRLQKILKRKIMEIDKDLNFYLITPTDVAMDPWRLDHDLGREHPTRPGKNVQIEKPLRSDSL